MTPQSREVLPDAIILLTGCRPWPLGYREDGVCPVCHDNARRAISLVVCLHCHAVSLPLSRLVASRSLGQMNHGFAAEARQAEQDAKRALAKSHETTLSERERRWIWGGCKRSHGKSADKKSGKVSNLALIGRQWLTQINQLPDWTLILDRRGNVIGRTEPPSEEVA